MTEIEILRMMNNFLWAALREVCPDNHPIDGWDRQWTQCGPWLYNHVPYESFCGPPYHKTRFGYALEMQVAQIKKDFAAKLRADSTRQEETKNMMVGLTQLVLESFKEQNKEV